MAKLKVHVDAKGHLVLPSEAAKAYGLKPGAQAFIDTGENRLILKAPASHLAKVYIEPTNACNLECRTCIRNDWQETTGFMTSGTFDRIVEGLRTFSPAPLVFFGGFGEPLFHPRIVEMVADMKAIGARVELITNATLLTAETSRRLVEAGLNVIWISLDGARPESYADVRLGAELPKVIANVSAFRDACMVEGGVMYDFPEKQKIGIVFVAMKRNIGDLPDVVRLGSRVGATRFLVTNVLPYTPDMWEQALCSNAISEWFSPPLFYVDLPRMDRNELTAGAIRDITNLHTISWPGADPCDTSNHCPFIERGSAAINWKGNLSPCLPLMYDHKSFANRQERFSKAYTVGNVSDTPLKDLWRDPDYVAFRERVQMFDFSPCILCGCYLSERNEEDCFGNSHPTCGGCAWAQGIVRCP
jgi:MoaA/NifB/PqqE/SkfB family radical SAM enzyme